MATPRDWATGYLGQAREDLAAAKALQGTAPSVVAMLLQMVFEKLGKAALLRSNQMTVHGAQASHAAASRMLAAIRRNRSLLRRLGNGYEHAWKDVMPVVTELERLHPAIAVHRGGSREPCLEYPWEDASGTVKWPARDLPMVPRLRDPRLQLGSRLVRFANQLAGDFDELFPE